MSMGGSGKGATGSSAQPAYVPPAPVYTYQQSESDKEAEKSKAAKAVALLKGRSSTILTDPSKLGEATVGKRTLLGV